MTFVASLKREKDKNNESNKTIIEQIDPDQGVELEEKVGEKRAEQPTLSQIYPNLRSNAKK